MTPAINKCFEKGPTKYQKWDLIKKCNNAETKKTPQQCKEILGDGGLDHWYHGRRKKIERQYKMSEKREMSGEIKTEGQIIMHGKILQEE